MKKYLLVLVVGLIFISFIEVKHRYWIGHSIMNDTKSNERWDIIRVIKADTEKDAIYKFDNFCKKIVPNGKYEQNGAGNFYVREVKENDIVK